ncbi:DUF2993 domain-containing protein [Pleurocapsa sp. PCC 7319]|uniref:LmeA family phospholipid-binding protein n=1 Tax=Pleurocapsa sp. PCC 7319 TaxID=118161 RepID=UPI00034D4CCE|nr:DUF2993 domain-containing protein [Pleurocapsa sp. PCC 7319]
MEVLTIVLSGLLSLVSSGGIILDSVAANRIRSQLISIEEQDIRVDNSPSYGIAQGKLQQVRIATRGVTIKPDLRIAVLELETDRVHFNRDKLDFNSIDGLRESLEQPLQGAAKLIVTEDDLNQALKSPEVVAQMQQVLNRLIIRKAGSTNISYQLIAPQVELNSANRFGVKFNLSRPSTNSEINRNAIAPSSTDSSLTRELAIDLEFKILVLKGKTIRIAEPQGTVNGRPMSSRLLTGFAEGISDRLNLSFLESNGILARILQLEIDEDKLKLVGFAKVETKTTQLSSNR